MIRFQASPLLLLRLERSRLRVTFGRTVLLGAIAGSTIFLGLPIGRLKDPRPRLKALLNAVSAGILIFLFFDILENATAPLDDLAQSAAGSASPSSSSSTSWGSPRGCSPSSMWGS